MLGTATHQTRLAHGIATPSLRPRLFVRATKQPNTISGKSSLWIRHNLNFRSVPANDVLCSSFAPGAATAQDIYEYEQPQQPEQHLQLVLQTLQRCRNVFLCLASVTAWCYLSSGSLGSTLFASVGLAASSASAVPGVGIVVKSAWTGLGAGFLHTLCGPDHLAALTPLTLRHSRAAACALGALWGFGHSTGQLILGIGMTLLKGRFHDFLPALERWSGVVVAATLVAIGGLGIYESHFAGEHGEGEHGEEEAQAMQAALAGGGALPASGSGSSGRLRAGLRVSFATYATGIVYGLQPDALFVVVPALTLPTKTASLAYCAMFVIGTVAAMGGYTLVIGHTSEALTREQPWLQKHLSTVASSFAIAVGLLVGLAGAGVNVPFNPFG